MPVEQTNWPLSSSKLQKKAWHHDITPHPLPCIVVNCTTWWTVVLLNFIIITVRPYLYLDGRLAWVEQLNNVWPTNLALKCILKAYISCSEQLAQWFEFRTVEILIIDCNMFQQKPDSFEFIPYLFHIQTFLLQKHFTLSASRPA